MVVGGDGHGAAGADFVQLVTDDLLNGSVGAVHSHQKVDVQVAYRHDVPSDAHQHVGLAEKRCGFAGTNDAARVTALARYEHRRCPFYEKVFLTQLMHGMYELIKYGEIKELKNGRSSVSVNSTIF